MAKNCQKEPKLVFLRRHTDIFLQCNKLFTGMVSPNLRVFRCRRCLSRLTNQMRNQNQQRGSTSGYNNFASGESASVKLKLPMMPKNGKRPIVELVLRTPEGRYQPIKFRNNSQITENIPRTLFHKVSRCKTLLF